MGHFTAAALQFPLQSKAGWEGVHLAEDVPKLSARVDIQVFLNPPTSFPFLFCSCFLYFHMQTRVAPGETGTVSLLV